MASLTNIAINARSMNNLITISDGQGTVIEDGQIDTDLLQADLLEVQQLNATNFTTNAMIANSLQLLRTSTTAVNNLLGVVVDIGKLTQNMTFDTVARQVQIWNDTATSQLMTIDVDNNAIQFNSFLPTSTQTPTTGTQLITKTYADSTFQPVGSYATLGGSNAFTGTNTFNTNLPTSTQTPSTGTQLITKTYADSTYQTTGAYVTLGGSNAFTGTNTFNTNLPTSTLSASTGNQFVTRDSGDARYQQIANNIIYVKNDASNNSFILGSGPTTLSGFENFTGGINAGKFITSGYYNTALSKDSLSSCTTGFENVACGFSSMVSTTTGNGNSCYGSYSGLSITNGYDNVMLGVGANVSNGSIYKAVAIGADSTAQESYEFVLGHDNNIITIPNKVKISSCQFPGGATVNLSFRTNENVILQDATTSVIQLPTPYAFDDQNVGAKFFVIRAVTTSTSSIEIRAPTGQTIGFNDKNGSLITGTSYYMLKAENTLTLLCVAKNGMTWVAINPSLATASSTTLISSYIPVPSADHGISFSPIPGGTPTVNYYAQFSDTDNLKYKPDTQTLTATNVVVTGTLSATSTTSTNATITDQTTSATTFYPTFVSATSGNLGLNAGSNLKYTPNTQTLLLSSGTFESYKTRSTTFQYLTQNTLITGTTTLSEPLKSYYPFTMKVAGFYTVTAPEVTALNVGTQLTFKRLGGEYDPLYLGMSANQPFFGLGSAQGTTSSPQTIVGAFQTCGTVVAIQSQDDGVGAFSNAVGSTTITIVAQYSGTLSIGGKLNLNGNIRYIIAYGSTGTPGRGGTGTYIVNSAIGGANTNEDYTSSLSYGWALTSQQ